MFNKNDEVEINITDIGNKGEGIGRIEDFVFFTDGGLPGDKALMKVLKVKKSYGYGKVLKIIEPSEDRTEPLCEIANKCGGCSFMHMKYESQLKFKHKKVKDSLERIGGFKEIEVLPVIPEDNLKGYRNKAQIPVRSRYNKIEMGFYAKNSHNIIQMKNCYIQQDIVEEVLIKLEKWMTDTKTTAYYEDGHRGIIRHILIKTGVKTKEVMICIVVNLEKGVDLKHQDKLIKSFTENPNVKSIVLNYNNRKDNVILGADVKTIWGSDHIEDYLYDIKYKISPLSFFQVNSNQAEKLYGKVVEFADIKQTDLIVDAYCGIGSISLCLAKKAGHVIGIEIVKEAIADAEENAKINNITNTEFIVGTAEESILELIEKGTKVDCIVVDPPRKGCEPEFLNAVMEIKPSKFIYVSCNPDTLSRDLKILSEGGYKIKKVQPVDMFGFTNHIETVVLMEY